MSLANSRGVGRVLTKLETAMDQGNYYEAHQLYRTLYFRYLGLKKFTDLLDLLYDGAIKLANKKEFCSSSDLGLLLIDVLEKSKTDEFEIWIEKISNLIKKIDLNVVERETLIVKAIKWSSEGNVNRSCGHPLMHKKIADLMWSENNFEQAKHHYLLSKDGIGFANMLIELNQKKAFANELDLMIAQVVLQLLCLKEKETALETFKTYTKMHPKISTSDPPFITPLLNFLYFLLTSIDDPKLPTFKALCELYKTALSRDPYYEKQLQTIGSHYFGLKIQREAAGGVFGELFNQLFQGLDSDDEDMMSSERNVDLD